MTHPPALILLVAPLAAEATVACGHPGLESSLHQAMASTLPVLMVTPPALATWARQRLPGRQVIVMPETAGPHQHWLSQAIRSGVQSSATAQGWLLLPAGLSSAKASTFMTLARNLSHCAVVYPEYQQVQGHPIGFSSEMYSELVRLDQDHDLIRLAARYPATAIRTNDPGVVTPRAGAQGLLRWHSPLQATWSTPAAP